MDNVTHNTDDPLVELAPNLPAGLLNGLRNYWYPVLQSEELPAGAPRAVMALGENLVAWRDADGAPCVVHDRCPHRSIRLSVGRVFDGQLQCILHGLRFNEAGACTMVPWESPGEAREKRPSVTAYPARELGGYVWAYLGDSTRFPPPPLESEVPEELTQPEAFIWFRLPTEIWKTSWLFAVDGSDAYHAVVLHATSQAVTKEEWTGGAARQADVSLNERRMKIVSTSHGIRAVSLDAEGKPLHHGHFTVDVKGDRFALPCIHSNPIAPAPGAASYVSRLWQFPIDAEHTMIVRYAVFRAADDAAREHATRTFHDLALPRLKKVSAEDAFAGEAQGDVVSARRSEHLLSPDVDVIGVRRLMHRAFTAPFTEGSRVPVREGALMFPL